MIKLLPMLLCSTLLILSACAASPPLVRPTPCYQVPPASQRPSLRGPTALAEWKAYLDGSPTPSDRTTQQPSPATPTATR